jgi:peptidoglycan/xylan/chitin deacetylase (PgdA/CDA1 family)
MLHQRLLDLLESRYRKWRASHSRPDGKPNHGRNVHWWATKLPRLAAPFFSDIIWRNLPANSEPNPHPPSISLTFDDGPSPDQTPRILDELARHNLHATFFVLGQQAEKHPKIIRDIAARGHQLGNHTWSHIDLWLNDFPIVAEELARTDDLLEQLTGRRPQWVRPPHGHFTAKLRAWCAERGQKVVLWDTMPGDFVDWATPESLTNFSLRHLRPGSILVLHDGPSMPLAAQTLPLLLPRLPPPSSLHHQP